MTDANIIKLPGARIPSTPGEPVDSVVDILQFWLDKAKRGELRALAVAGVSICSDGELSIDTNFTAPDQVWILDAAIGRLTRRWHKAID